MDILDELQDAQVRGLHGEGWGGITDVMSLIVQTSDGQAYQIEAGDGRPLSIVKTTLLDDKPKPDNRK